MRAVELAALPEAERAAWFKRQTDKSAAAYEYDWSNWARDDQLPPPGAWDVWLLLAGRGFGKTRAGAEWVRGQAMAHPGARIALVAATPAEARSVMVEGVCGLLAISSAAERPEYESSLKRLSWPNGSAAQLFGASDADSLRGPEHDFAWCDEIGKWDDGAAAWDNLMLTMRRGANPRVVATTTPRGGVLLRRLVQENGVHVTCGSSSANRLHLAGGYLGNAIASRAVRMVAEAVGEAPLVASDPVLVALVRRASGGQALLETLAAQLMLHGNAYVQVLGGADGVPSELFALRPERVSVEADARGWTG